MSVASVSKNANLTTLNQTLELSCGGYGTVGIQLAGTWVGTVTFEGTVDHGTWQTLNVTKTNSTSQVTSATGNGVWTGPVAGLLAVRCRFSTATSGMVEARMLIAGTGGGSGSGGGGGGGGTSSDFGAAFPAAGTAAGFQGATGNMEPVILEADGSLPVTIVAGAGSGGTSSAFGAAFPADGTAAGVADPDGNMRPLSAETLDYDTGAGSAPQTLVGIALPASGGPVAGGTATNPIQVGDAGGSITVDGTVTANAGTNLNTSALALEATLSTLNGKVTACNTGAVTISAALPAGNNNIGDVDIASSALPTGASTLAEQQTQTTALGTLLTSANFAAAFGTAGTPDSQVMSVQGIASMTPVQVSQATASNLNVTVASKTVYTRPVYGTAQTVFNSSTDIAGGAFSAAGTDFTNNDAAIGAALYADAMIEMPDWAAAPVAGTVVQLWGLLINTDGTDDDTDAPSAAAPGGARLLGSWVIAAADALQRRTITISLAGIQSGFTPYIFNGTAQNMNNDAGTNMVVKITPWNLAQVG